ncbi:hypothetical protein NMY22_g4185 [Coprinellus aureogranulatus]|nr:hypothetical protein NMY22_g4185 [Coprinellus aureogranulatus]
MSTPKLELTDPATMTRESEEEVNLADTKQVNTFASEIFKSCKEEMSLKGLQETFVDILNERVRRSVACHMTSFRDLEKVLRDFVNRDHPPSGLRLSTESGDKGNQRISPSDLDYAARGLVSMPTRVGTSRWLPKPFMAVELLEYPAGAVKRTRRHDLESAIWTIVWLCRQDPRWYKVPHDEVYRFKMSYCSWAKPHRLPKGIEKEFEALWRPVTKVLTAWMRLYGDADMEDTLDSLSEDNQTGRWTSLRRGVQGLGLEARQHRSVATQWASVHPLRGSSETQTTHRTMPEGEHGEDMADNKHEHTLACEVLKLCKKGVGLKEFKELIGDLLNSREKVPYHRSLITSSKSGHPTLSSWVITASWSNKGVKFMSLSDLGFEFAATANGPVDLSRLSESSESRNELNRTAHATFMAVELLKYPTIKHIHRHDLESVIWVLVWLCRQDPDWYNSPHGLIASSKAAYTWATACEMPSGIKKHYEVVWPLVANVVCDWMGTYLRTSARRRLDTLSDDKILAAIEEEFPRPEESRDWDWAHFIITLRGLVRGETRNASRRVTSPQLLSPSVETPDFVVYSLFKVSGMDAPQLQEREVDLADNTLVASQMSKLCKKATSLKEFQETLDDLLNERARNMACRRSLIGDLNKILQDLSDMDQPIPCINSGTVNGAIKGDSDKCEWLTDVDCATARSLASLMTLRDGSQTTLSKPFMAIELLEYPGGTVKRALRHDFESVIWALVWLCRQDPDWYNFSDKLVCLSKMSYSGWAKPRRLPDGIEKKYEVLWRPVVNVVTSWMQLYSLADQQEMLESLSDGQVLDAIKQDKAFSYCKGSRDWDWEHFLVQ